MNRTPDSRLPSNVTPASSQELAGLRHQLTTQGRDVTNRRVIEAMMHVPRHAFVPPALRPEAYLDGPLPIGHHQTISQPFIVSFMTEAIDPQPADRVLEIGAGCGYQTAVLAELVREVFAIEIVPPLARQAALTLGGLGYHNVHLRHGDGWLGWKESAPFDAILVACSPNRIPHELVEQLKPGGRMILPVGDTHRGQELTLVEKRFDGYVSQAVLPVRFVPMTGRAENAASEPDA